MPLTKPRQAFPTSKVGLGLDHTDGALVDIEQVVRSPVHGLHDRLADSDALAGEQVQVLAVLDAPAAVGPVSVRCSASRSCSPARSATVSTGANPAHDVKYRV